MFQNKPQKVVKKDTNTAILHIHKKSQIVKIKKITLYIIYIKKFTYIGKYKYLNVKVKKISISYSNKNYHC